MLNLKEKYLIAYVCLDKDDKYIHSGKIKVSAKDPEDFFSEMKAKASLEKMLQNKYQNFGRLIIIDCQKENFSKKLDDLISWMK